MKKKTLSSSVALMSTSALLAMVSLASCASNGIKKYDYGLSTNPTDEIARLDSEMHSAMKRQVNVLSPSHYTAAREKLDDARKENQSSKANDNTLDDLGYARAHLDAANATAIEAEKVIPEVIKARTDAITAQAPQLRPEKLEEADEDLAGTTKNFEKGDYQVSVEKKGKLQKKYLGVELAAIKASNLDDTRAMIESAKKMKAQKLVKNTLASAEEKYQIAEHTIETDRHDTATITRSADDARNEAKRLLKVTKLAQGAKEGSPEAVALDLEQRQMDADQSKMTAEQRQAQLERARQNMRSQSAVIGAVSAENAKLADEQRFNEAFTEAQEKFDKDEADVYRQGDNLLIRLKTMKFATGRADLPKHSLDILSKVKEVVESMDAQKVVVEGHTDSVGSKTANMKLSDTRAKVVGEYLISTNAVTSDHLETKGLGFSQPITSNKTKEGRAENRRVDVIITPSKAEFTPPKPANTDTSSNSTTSPSDTAPMIPKTVY